MVSRIVIALIGFYQKALSPLKMPSCRFYPSCSEYFKVAVGHKGLVRGSLLGVYRILRCNPFCRGGYDPVPGVDERGKGEKDSRQVDSPSRRPE